jgi:hypothetical protein
VSLSAFYGKLARLVGDPELVRRVRGGDVDWLRDGDVTALEADRLAAMAADPRFAVLCSLYRSNRLTALVRTVPSVVVALGDRLSETVTEFWRESAPNGMQFRSEAESFCAHVRRQHPDDLNMQRIVDQAEIDLVGLYEEGM